MRNKLFSGVILIFWLFGGLFALSQSEKDRSVFYDYGKRFYFETHTLPVNTGDSINILTLFRISNSLLSFTKNGKGYSAFPQVELEYRDSNEIIKKRLVWKDTIIVIDYNDTKQKSAYNFGNVTAKLPTGKYKLNILLTDNGKNQIREIKHIIPKTSFAAEGNFSLPFFFRKDVKGNAGQLVPFVFDNDIDFCNSPVSVYCIVSSGDTAMSFNYFFKYLSKRQNVTEWAPLLNFNLVDAHSFSILGKSKENAGQTGRDSAVYFSGVTKIIPFKSLALNVSNDNKQLEFNEINFEWQNGTNRNLFIGLVKFEIPPEYIVPGNYSLLLWAGKKKDTTENEFKIEWEDMPLSLKNPEYASELMFNILDDKEFKELRSGSKGEIFNNIIKYWKKNDPSPYSPFNEAMAEYFRRVDYSFFNFQTIREPDGAKTERGKIFILQGAPDKIKRDMNSSGIINEVWTYSRLKQNFVFETSSNGEFFLKQIDEIKK